MTTEGVIQRGASYTKSEFLRRAGLSKHSWESMCRAGFPIRRLGNRAYVLGDCWLDWLERLPAGERVANGDAGQDEFAAGL